MALHAFLKLAGSKTGQIKGSASQKGREGMIPVIGVDHEIESAYDPDTGHPTGKLKHGLFVVTKDIDLSSPLLHKAHGANDELTECKIHFWRMPPTGGREENYYVVGLQNARIAYIRTAMGNIRREPNQLIPEYEEVGFTYEQIVWTFKAAEGSSEGGQQASMFEPALWGKLEGRAKKLLTEQATMLAKMLQGKLQQEIKDAAGEQAKPPANPQ